MSNEELAVLVKAGERDPLELWWRVRKLVLLQANKRAAAFGVQCGVDVDDLLQAGYIAFMQAVDAFDPAKGYKFTTYLTRPLQTEFNRCLGRLTSKRDPLNGGCASLDVAAGDEGITPLIDLLEDPTAEQPFDTVIEQAGLHEAIEATLQKISPGNAAIIRAKFYEGKKITLQEHVRAFKQLRKPQVCWMLKQYR